MSLPRAVVPGRVYMLTRRCSERRFMMRPCDETNNAFIYCLGLAAQKYGVDVVFTAAMSNHHHTGVVDIHGRLPDFLAHFHKLFAKHQNTILGRWEAFWAPEQTSVVQLTEGDDVLARMAYALANPVKDHLVENAHDWPGVSSLSATIAEKPMTATRPKRFFREDGDLPRSVSLELVRPTALGHLTHAEFVKQLQDRIGVIEKRAAAERAQTRRSVIGRNILLCQNWRHSPESREPRRQLTARVASRNTWRRIEVLLRDRAWLAAYRKARDEFIAGMATCFPAGTFWLRRFAGVSCEPFLTG